ncbi:MAG: hypothetical protein NTY04_00980, partial [Candidatus Staskawiczbacteria bacterium]|nr:hypothetical protein [Candidatus Staskawiczbacteria bacterium]
AEGIGKKLFAIEFIKFLNCFDKNKPCGKCANCQMIDKNGFPDLLVVKSINSKSSIKNEKDSLEIDISQIRAAQNFLSYKSYYGSFKTVIVDNAERMNQEAQSCFLKTLEEPKGKTLLILISSRPDMMLQTIFSRCQTLKFSKPKDLPQNSEKVKREEEILENLISVINSDFAEKFKYVKSLDFDKQNPLEILEVIQKYFRKQLLNNFSDKKAKKILELAEEINNKLTFTNANPKLALEILLMEF